VLIQAGFIISMDTVKMWKSACIDTSIPSRESAYVPGTSGDSVLLAQTVASDMSKGSEYVRCSSLDSVLWEKNVQTLSTSHLVQAHDSPNHEEPSEPPKRKAKENY
jgi:hypothetical protein